MRLVDRLLFKRPAAEEMSAALGPQQSPQSTWKHQGSSKKQHGDEQLDAKAKLAMMVAHDVGFVRRTVNFYPNVVSAHIQLEVQEFNKREREWVPSKYGPAWEILRLFRHRTGGMPELVRQLLWFWEVTGDLAMVSDHDGQTWHIDMHSWHLLSRRDAGRNEIHDAWIVNQSSEDAFNLEQREVAAPFVRRCYEPRKDEPGKPQAPLLSALPHILQWIRAVSSIDRDLDSKVAQEDVLHFDARGTELHWPDEYREWISNRLDLVSQWGSVEGHAHKDFSPFAYQSGGEPATRIKVGPDLEDAQRSGLISDRAIDDFCRSMDAFKSFVLGDMSAQTFANASAESRQDLLRFVIPRVEFVGRCATYEHLYPWARRLTTFSENPERYRIVGTVPALEAADDRTDAILEADRVSQVPFLRRDVKARLVGANVSDLVQEGSAEWDAGVAARLGVPVETLPQPDDEVEPDSTGDVEAVAELPAAQSDDDAADVDEADDQTDESEEPDLPVAAAARTQRIGL